MEGFPSRKNKRNHQEQIKNPESIEFASILHSLKNKKQIEMSPDQKLAFLKWCVSCERFLLHGSNINNIQEIEPRLANCNSKEFGNQDAVFANEDPNITMFYALKKKDFEGIAESSIRYSTDTLEKEYIFSFRAEDPTPEACLAEGSIYLLDRDSFIQGTDDSNNIIDEWASKKPIKPQAEIQIGLEDFPYLSDVKYIKDFF